MTHFLDARFLNNSIRAWALALVVAGVIGLALRVLARWSVRRLTRIADHTKTYWDDVLVEAISKTKALFGIVVALYAGSEVLTMGRHAEQVVRAAVVIALLVQGGIWVSAALTAWLTRYRKAEMSEDPAAVTTMSALGFLGKLVLWAVILLLTLDNLGVNITALVAGLGVGGVAVALALQNILGDLFASLSIVLDKPFVLGDFLIVDQHLGNVEYIGLKTTRLRSLSGEQLIFSNSDLLKSRIRNFGRMYQRRIVFTLGVTYQTPRAKLEIIPGIIRQAIEAQQKTKFDRSHFSAYGDFAINFESVYYVTVADYYTYMDVQQAIYLRIHERFEQEGIEFAYPTQTLFVVKQEE